MPDQHYAKYPAGHQYYDKTIPTESRESIIDRCKTLVPKAWHHFFDPVLPPVSQELTSAQRAVLGLKTDTKMTPEEAQEIRDYRQKLSDTIHRITCPGPDDKVLFPRHDGDLDTIQKDYRTYVKADNDLLKADAECKGVYGVDAPPDIQERIRQLPEGSRNRQPLPMTLPCMPCTLPTHEAPHSSATDRRAHLGAPVANPSESWPSLITSMYCDTNGLSDRDPIAHMTMWDPEQMTQYVTAHHIRNKPILMQARIGFRPTASVGIRAVCSCRQRKWGSSHHCVNEQSCVGSQGDMLNRMLIPEGEMWQPGVVVCDSCAAMMSLAGRSNHPDWKDAHHVVFDFDLSQNHDEEIQGMTFRRIGHYSVGEQPSDRIRHRYRQLKEQYADLRDVEFDVRGMPSTPESCARMRQAYMHHVHTAHVAKPYAIEDFSLWRHTHDPCLVAMMNKCSLTPPSLSRMKRIIETPN